MGVVVAGFAVAGTSIQIKGAAVTKFTTLVTKYRLDAMWTWNVLTDVQPAAPNTLSYHAMVAVLRAAYDTVASRFVLHEAYRRQAWVSNQTQLWVADGARSFIIRAMNVRFAAGEYVLLKRKRSGQDPPVRLAGELQVSNPGAQPTTILGGQQYYYETVAGGFSDGGGRLISGFERNGTVIRPADKDIVHNDDDDVAERDQLFKKFKVGGLVGSETRHSQVLDPPLAMPLPGTMVTLPSRIRGVLTTASDLLEHMNTSTDQLKWMVSASMVGVGDPARERADFVDVVQYATTVLREPVPVRHPHCCSWYIECDSTRSSGTLQPVSSTVSEGRLSNGDVMTATVHEPTMSVQFAVCDNTQGTYEHVAGVTFDAAANLFVVSVAPAVQSMWYMYRLAPHGLAVAEREFTVQNTQCDSLVPHRKSVAYGDGAGRLTLIGEAEQATAAVGGGVVQVRAWVDDATVDAVLTGGGEPDTIVTAAAISKAHQPHWLHLVEHASVGDLPATITAMDRYMRTVASASPTNSVPVPEAISGYTTMQPSPPHYRLIPMKGDDYDYTSVFGQSVNSHHDTFRFINEPGQWFVGATPSRAVDGLECALGYLQQRVA